MILIHPTYFPSIAQMVAIVQSDGLVFEVEDNYQKQTYRNRAYIAHTNGRLSLNVPIKHSINGERQVTKEVVVENSFPWQSQHWKSIQTAYRTSPFFEFYEDDLEPLFLTKVENLMRHNLAIFEVLCDLIGIPSQYDITTEYLQEPPQRNLRYLVEAKGEKKYNLEPYSQVLEAHHGFLENLSVLDLLFNQGPSALDYLERQKLPFS